MNEPYSILFQKESETAAIDSIEKWGVACRKFPFQLDGGVKDLASRDWPGLDGEDTFFPNVLPLKPYDLQADMVYVGPLSSAYDNLMAFRRYLIGDDGKGTKLMVYNSHTGIGRQACHLLDMGDMTFNKEVEEEVVQFSLKIRVTDPRTSIVATKDLVTESWILGPQQ